MIEICFVFINLRHDYATGRQALVNYITCKEQGSNFEDRDKAEKCRTILRQIIKMVKERLITLAWRLHYDLSNDVFDQGTVTMKEHIRVNCTLKSLICKILR